MLDHDENNIPNMVEGNNNSEDALNKMNKQISIKIKLPEYSEGKGGRKVKLVLFCRFEECPS